MSDKPTTPADGSIRISAKLLHVIPDDLTAVHADQIAVSADPDGVHLYVFQYKKPLILGTPSEKAQKARNVKEMRAICINQIVISPRVALEFVKLLTETTSMYVSDKSERE